MPITGPIPLPDSGMDEFLKQLQIGQENRYRKGTLDVSQKAEQRQQQLLPYLISKYQQEQAEVQMKQNLQRQFYNDMMGGVPSPSRMAPTSAPSNNEEQPANVPRFSSAQAAMYSENGQPDSIDQAAEKLNKNLISREKQPINYGQNAPQQAVQSALNQNAMPQQVQEQPQQPLTNKFVDIQKRINSGDEVMVRSPRNPKMERWDKFAGQDVFGIKIPDIKSKVIDGVRYDTYPSGKVIAQKEGPSDEEKVQLRLNAAEDRAQATANIKEGAKIEESADSLAKTAELAKEAKKILSRNENLTGMHNWVGLKTKLTKNKDLARLKYLFGEIQAQIGKYAAPRGGIQSVGWAGTIKPDLLSDQGVNEAMLDQAIENSKSDYNRENERYKSKLNKSLPVKFPEIEAAKRKYVNKKTGEEKMLTADEARTLGVLNV